MSSISSVTFLARGRRTEDEQDRLSAISKHILGEFGLLPKCPGVSTKSPGKLTILNTNNYRTCQVACLIRVRKCSKSVCSHGHSMVFEVSLVKRLLVHERMGFGSLAWKFYSIDISTYKLPTFFVWAFVFQRYNLYLSELCHRIYWCEEQGKWSRKKSHNTNVRSIFKYFFFLLSDKISYL